MSVTFDIDLLAKRIAERLDAMGLSERQASLKATGQPDAIRYIRTRRAMPSLPRLLRIAESLQVDPAYLLGETDKNEWREVSSATANSDITTRSQWDESNEPLLAPVLGVVPLRHDVFNLVDSGVISVEVSNSTNQMIDTFTIPRTLEYGMYFGIFAPDSTMDPLFEMGSPVLLSGDAKPKNRDYVFVELKSAESDGSRPSMLKRFIGRTDEWLTLQQFNPPATFRVPWNSVADISKLVPYGDLVRGSR